MTEDMAEYKAALKNMNRDCDTCARPEPGTQVCPMRAMDIDTCLGNPSRPFWRPGPIYCRVSWDRAEQIRFRMDGDDKLSSILHAQNEDKKFQPESCSRDREDDQYITPDTQDLIREECDIIRYMLTEKNRKYGDSAINPVRIFSKADPVAQIDVRMDDKLSRIRSAQDDDTEDPELDLIGYLILKRVAKRKGNKA